MFSDELELVFGSCLEEPLDERPKGIFADLLETNGHPELAQPLRESLLAHDPVPLSEPALRAYPPLEWACQGWLGHDLRGFADPAPTMGLKLRGAVRVELARLADHPFLRSWKARLPPSLFLTMRTSQILPHMREFLRWGWIQSVAHWDLSGTYPGQSGLRRLARAGPFPRLVAVDLRRNMLNPACLDPIRDWVERCPIRRIDARGNPRLAGLGGPLGRTKTTLLTD